MIDIGVLNRICNDKKMCKIETDKHVYDEYYIDRVGISEIFVNHTSNYQFKEIIIPNDKIVSIKVYKQTVEY